MTARTLLRMAASWVLRGEPSLDPLAFVTCGAVLSDQLLFAAASPFEATPGGYSSFLVREMAKSLFQRVDIYLGGEEGVAVDYPLTTVLGSSEGPELTIPLTVGLPAIPATAQARIRFVLSEAIPLKGLRAIEVGYKADVSFALQLLAVPTSGDPVGERVSVASGLGQWQRATAEIPDTLEESLSEVHLLPEQPDVATTLHIGRVSLLYSLRRRPAPTVY